MSKIHENHVRNSQDMDPVMDSFLTKYCRQGDRNELTDLLLWLHDSLTEDPNIGNIGTLNIIIICQFDTYQRLQ